MKAKIRAWAFDIEEKLTPYVGDPAGVIFLPLLILLLTLIAVRCMP